MATEATCESSDVGSVTSERVADAPTTSIAIPVLRDRKIRSWPKYPIGGGAEPTSLHEVLTRTYPTDAHFAAYRSTALARRLSLDALRLPDARAKLLDGVSMDIAVFDVDCGAAHGGDARRSGAHDVDAWWIDETEKLTALFARHPGAFVYRTRGGYRIVYRLPESIVLREEFDAEAWSSRYCTWIAYLAREFEIVADVACRDWTRLFRAPHATRDDGGSPEHRETIGDPRFIGTWTCEPTADDRKAARKFKKQRVRKERDESTAATPGPASAGDGVLAHAFRAKNWLGELIEPGKWSAICPNSSAHTTGAPFDGSTVLFAPAIGEQLGWFHCSHAHCQGRTVRNALSAFSEAELRAARQSAGLGSERASNGSAPEADHEQAEPSAASLPEIRCGPDLHENTNSAELALSTIGAPLVFTNARRLVIVAKEGAPKIRGVRREDGAPFIHGLEFPGLREHLARAAIWLSWDKRTGDWVQSLPPGPVVAALLARGEWRSLPHLVGIVQTPTMRADGSVLDSQGYDARSGILFDPGYVEYPRVPSEPTAEEVQQAVAALREPFEEFEWADQASDIAVMLALVLTPLARAMFDGPSPCFGIDSTTRGSGKGLSADVAVTIGTGRRPAVSMLSAEAEEQRKMLFALTLEGQAAILLDNITRPLGGSVLSAALTAGEIRDRVLGESRSSVAPFRAVVVATGNGLRFIGDFDRRVVVARQAPSVENPEDREPKGGFRHPDLRAWVNSQLPRLIVAGLTILRAFHVAGRPAHGRKSMGSFESWDGVVRAACIWAGIGDPLACRERIREGADEDRERIQGLLTSWRDALDTEPATVAQAIERSRTHEALQHALAEFDSKGSIDRPNATSIGRRLRSIIGRIVGGKKLVRAGTQSPVVYRIEVVGGTGLVGLEGVDPATSVTPAHARARAYSQPPEEPPATPTTPVDPHGDGASEGCDRPVEALLSPEPVDSPCVDRSRAGPQNACYCCGGSEFVRVSTGPLWVCIQCHPPDPRLIVERWTAPDPSTRASAPRRRAKAQAAEFGFAGKETEYD